MNIWLTSDLHFMHDKPFLYEPRGFTSITEMNEAVVERWNSVVKPDDVVYNLGDIAFNDINRSIHYINLLNGHQYWIRGNHDTNNKISEITSRCYNVEFLGWVEIIKSHKSHIYLSHYPTLTTNYDEDKYFSRFVICMHGHTHSLEKWQDLNNPFLYNVALDAHNCYPVNIEEAMSDIRKCWERNYNE